VLGTGDEFAGGFLEPARFPGRDGKKKNWMKGCKESYGKEGLARGFEAVRALLEVGARTLG